MDLEIKKMIISFGVHDNNYCEPFVKINVCMDKGKIYNLKTNFKIGMLFLKAFFLFSMSMNF